MARARLRGKRGVRRGGEGGGGGRGGVYVAIGGGRGDRVWGGGVLPWLRRPARVGCGGRDGRGVRCAVGIR